MFRVVAYKGGREEGEVPIFRNIPVKGIERVHEHEEKPVLCQQAGIAHLLKRQTYQRRNKPASLMPMSLGFVPRCKALKMMTGKAEEYFNALARCCPPQPELEVGCFRTLWYSMRHCRSRIKLGMLIMRGTMYAPPQLRSGLSVEDTPGETNMHVDTNRSPRTLA